MPLPLSFSLADGAVMLLSCSGGLSSQVQHFIKSNFIGCFPTKTFSWSEIQSGNKPANIFLSKQRHYCVVLHPRSFVARRERYIGEGGAPRSESKTFMIARGNHTADQSSFLRGSAELSASPMPPSLVPFLAAKKGTLPYYRIKYYLIFCTKSIGRICAERRLSCFDLPKR